MVVDQTSAQGEEQTCSSELIHSLRGGLGIFYQGNLVFLHFLYSCDVISCQFLLEYLEFFLTTLFDQSQDEGASKEEKLAQRINPVKLVSLDQAKIYTHLVLKTVRKKDAGMYLKLVELFKKYLDPSLTMKIKVADLRESFTKAIHAFDDRCEKLTKNLEVGTHELEINSFYHNFIVKGIKNSLRSEGKDQCITSLYDFGFS